MTKPSAGEIRSKSANVDNIFLRATESYRSSTPQPDVIQKIDDYIAEALLFISDIIDEARAEDPEKNENKSAEQLLADPEMTKRFRERFTDVFMRKLNRPASNVEQGRMIDPAANLKATLLGATKRVL
jgi:hypothetical protein